ncbi:uncharacterized protein LOC136766892 [Amia ocellicauda]|uniref:uncharacterized protein LOC136766892 n=1 Tax=Amia ocellicauda TaxID=2972642 RepID=UPI0034640E2C
MEVESAFVSAVNGAPQPASWDSPAALPGKRKRGSAPGDGCVCGPGDSHRRDTTGTHRSSFISIPANRGVYYSECWKPNGSTLYLPVTNSLLVNMEKYDQVSFEEGFFFIGDKSGGFLQKEQGQAIHCWRYSDQEKKLFIALSYFFVNVYMFQEVMNALGGL